ncbi:MAG: bifunctional diaminohydroxyphosphoribosylaminopyrimidine deaminase/5-amino-6-(5-phosphoribosylamino)uracil reductase RibD, partial [Gammaproteobacteria bacterium]
MFNENDRAWMMEAIALAKNGVYTTRENPRVGCVLVKNGEIIAKAWHEFPGGPHAEVNALAKAGEEAKDATCYVSLSPCTHFGKTPPCYEALKTAGIARIIAATRDPNPLVDELENVEYDLCQDEAQALNPGFFMRMQQQRPFIRLKTGMSLDGRTAMENGQSQWITGTKAREYVQKIRAQSCAILTGINTVLLDNPKLTVRDETILATPHFKQPVRVILDTHLRMPLDAKLFDEKSEIWIYTAAQNNDKIKQLQDKGAKVFMIAQNKTHLDLHEVLKHLAEQKINEVLV